MYEDTQDLQSTCSVRRKVCCCSVGLSVLSLDVIPSGPRCKTRHWYLSFEREGDEAFLVWAMADGLAVCYWADSWNHLRRSLAHHFCLCLPTASPASRSMSVYTIYLVSRTDLLTIIHLQFVPQQQCLLLPCNPGVYRRRLPTAHQIQCNTQYDIRQANLYPPPVLRLNPPPPLRHLGTFGRVQAPLKAATPNQRGPLIPQLSRPAVGWLADSGPRNVGNNGGSVKCGWGCPSRFLILLLHKMRAF